MKIHFGIVWENMTHSTELPRDFCAGISPLQLGVVLVFNKIKTIDYIDLILSGIHIHSMLHGYKINLMSLFLDWQDLVWTAKTNDLPVRFFSHMAMTA